MVLVVLNSNEMIMEKEKKNKQMRIIFLVLGLTTIILMIYDMITDGLDMTNNIFGLVSGLCLLGGAFGIYDEKESEEEEHSQ